MAKRKEKSGMEVLGKRLQVSGYGPIKNMFVISALEKFAKEVLVADLPKNFMIHPDAWRGVAREVIADLQVAFPI